MKKKVEPRIDEGEGGIVSLPGKILTPPLITKGKVWYNKNDEDLKLFVVEILAKRFENNLAEEGVKIIVSTDPKVILLLN